MSDPILVEKLMNDPEKAIPEQMRFKDADFCMLPKVWNSKTDPSGWLITEKYDGVRAYWDGKGFYNKNGELIASTTWFNDLLPKHDLDGELWAGHLAFPAVRHSISKGWENLKFVVFDAPKHSGNYEERLRFLKEVIPASNNVMLVPVTKCKSKDHLMKFLHDILSAGGEGIVLRDPKALYTTGRSSSCLKVKPTYLMQVKVTALEHISGGKYHFATVINKLGQTFSLYRRVSQSRFPEIKKDLVITIGFGGFHLNGTPKFPVVLESHPGLKWKDVIPYHLTSNSNVEVKCEGCDHMIKNSEPRVSVHGVFRKFTEFGREPAFRPFEFCGNVECIVEGTYEMKNNGINFPPFENRVACKNTKSNVGELLESQGIQIVESKVNDEIFSL